LQRGRFTVGARLSLVCKSHDCSRSSRIIRACPRTYAPAISAGGVISSIASRTHIGGSIRFGVDAAPIIATVKSAAVPAAC